MNDKTQTINILLVALNDKFCKNVSTRLAETLDMFVVDCHQMIVYDLVNPKQVLETCGVEYLQKRERSVMKLCRDFNNTVISIDFHLFYEFSCLFDKSLIIYLRLPEDKTTKVANKLDFANRDSLLVKQADILITNDKCIVKQSVNKIIEKLGVIYEDC